MMYDVIDIEFDLNDSLSEEYSLSFDEEIALRDSALGICEADNEDDLIEEITTGAGWCIKSIDYNIQLKQGYDRSISVTSAGCFIASDDYNNSITNEFHYDF